MNLSATSKLLLLGLLTVAYTFALEEVKRVPTGFVGMRGKKFDPVGFSDLDKRGPSLGFHGMRGKKDYLPDNELFEKRGPSLGFHGMRGKKDDQDIAHESDMFEKRGPSFGFHGMRGKKDQDLDYRMEQDYLDSMDKRVRSMGFQGVRGKKDGPTADDNDYYADDKKSLVLDENKLPEYIDMGDEASIWQDELGNLNKRAPKGFFGMRGKKVSSGFFGVRGKKGPSNAFFGVRGKKAPSSGFFGVRGKKDGEENLDSLLHYLSEGEGFPVASPARGTMSVDKESQPVRQ